MLDSYLTNIPDTPYSSGTGPSRATFDDGSPSNSIMAQVWVRPHDDLNWMAPDISHLCSQKLGGSNGSHSCALFGEEVHMV